MAPVSAIPRIVVRGVRLAGTLAGLSMSALLGRNGTTASERALWLQRASTRILRILGVELDAVGNGYSRGLVVANHVGYLDVLVLAALWPAVFVAKSEVRDWPVFGPLTRAAGTL